MLIDCMSDHVEKDDAEATEDERQADDTLSEIKASMPRTRSGNTTRTSRRGDQAI